MTQLLSSRKVSAMQMSDNFIPNGATITPVDDYTIWLRCADLPNTYGSLANVISDTTAMETLCNNLNALRYMVRGEDVIMPAVLANSDWVAELDNSTYAIKIPTMTSNTTPSGVASASSTYNATTNAAWKAFDKVLTAAGYWRTPNGSTTNQWLKYQFPHNVHVYKLTYQYNGDAGYTPKNYKIQVSTDDVSYTDAKTGVLPNNILTETMLINNTTSGNHWRYLMVDLHSGTYFVCIEMQMYGLDLT